MIQLTDEYFLRSDSIQWILVKKYKGLSRSNRFSKGKQVETTTETYHGTLPQVARHLLNNGIKGKEVDNLATLANRLDELSETILSNIGDI
jgi:hypothetical protein